MPSPSGLQTDKGEQGAEQHACDRSPAFSIRDMRFFEHLRRLDTAVTVSE
jgi:hypothetical protein